MDDHYAGKIDIETLAGHAHFSKYHFVRVFKEIYGITPVQYLINVRIEKAKSLIENGASISEACWQVGFESISTFIGLFKEKAGVTSSIYRDDANRLKKLVEEKPSLTIPSCLSRKTKMNE